MPQEQYSIGGPPMELVRKAAKEAELADIDRAIARQEADPNVPEWRKAMVRKRLALKKAEIRAAATKRTLREMSSQGGR